MSKCEIIFLLSVELPKANPINPILSCDMCSFCNKTWKVQFSEMLNIFALKKRLVYRCSLTLFKKEYFSSHVYVSKYLSTLYKTSL
jgi:hypothetical protein